jgi:hypothetical protein
MVVRVRWRKCVDAVAWSCGCACSGAPTRWRGRAGALALVRRSGGMVMRVRWRRRADVVAWSCGCGCSGAPTRWRGRAGAVALVRRRGGVAVRVRLLYCADAVAWPCGCSCSSAPTRWRGRAGAVALVRRRGGVAVRVRASPTPSHLRQPVQRTVDAEPGHDLERLHRLPCVQLALSSPAVLKEDRRLVERAADDAAPEEDLLLE